MNLRKPIITFSFDDGHPNDLKVAKLLKKYNLRATFYIPITNYENEVMTDSQIRKLHSMGIEIGSHGLTHRRLPSLSFGDAEKELTLSKTKLETIIGEKVRGFCFAGGKYNRSHLGLPLKAGYLYARTTRLLRMNKPIQGHLFHTTLPYPFFVIGYFSHLLRHPNISGWRLFLTSGKYWGNKTKPNELAKHFIALGIKDKSCFHLYGHSYEFKTKEDWKTLEELLEYAGSQKDTEFLTNYDAFQKINIS